MEGLLEAPAPQDTDLIPAELPGIPLASDFDDAHVVQSQHVTETDIVAAAMANANLAPSQEGVEITGVHTEDDDNPRDAHIVSDGEESDDDDSEEDGYGFRSKNPTVDFGNNHYGILAEEDEDITQEQASVQGVEDDGSDQYSNNDNTAHHAEEGHHEDGVNENEDEAAGLRRSKRRRKKKHAQVFDFKNRRVQGADGVVHVQTREEDFSYRPNMDIPTPKCSKIGQSMSEHNENAYRMIQGMLHINPSVLQQARDEFRCQDAKR